MTTLTNIATQEPTVELIKADLDALMQASQDYQT